ncbi:hypothetical protein JYU16_01460 [bacterium AH-315-M05]|nr:hypothetical protein [bacterium AH-315-M05]
MYIILIGVYSCSTQSDALKLSINCEDVAPTYTEVIKPILRAYCLSCHAGSEPQMGLDFTHYEGIEEVAKNGRVSCAVKGESGCKRMPVGARLNKYTIQKIVCWIENGAKNN